MSRALTVAGIVAAVAGLAKAHAEQFGYDFTSSSRFGWSAAWICLLVGSSYSFGLPDGRSRSRFGPAVGAVVVATTLMSLIQLLVGDAMLPRSVVFGSAAIAVPWLAFCSVLADDGRSREADRGRVLVVGPESLALELGMELEQSPERAATVVGTLTAIEAAGDGRIRPISALADREQVSVLVLDRESQESVSIMAQAAELHQRGCRVRTPTLFYEEWLGKIPVSELEQISLMFDIGEIHRQRYSRMKRVIDLAVAIMLTPALAVVTPAIWTVNLVANRGPLFFRQERVGRWGSTFTMIKFRTMREASDGDADWTQDGDARVRPFGGFLRRSHLDELPQILNVLRGDLSMVGPRPEQPRYVGELGEKLPFYGVRHLVRPGLTGWAQVKYGYGSDEDGALEKLQYEFYYLRRQSLALDMRILGRTARTVAGRTGR